ncbi:unnamed protein product, partial [Effrenium voratum]
ACEMVDRKPGCSVSAAVLFRLFGLAAVNSPATCHREVMCLGAPIVSGHAACECHLASQVPKVQAAKALDKPQASSSVEGLLAAAVSATGEAPNRAVKRRVRQRLHKKLGAVLNKEEFERAMECFHTAAEAQRREEGLRAPKRGAPALPSRAVGQQAKAAPSFVAVPVVMVPSMDARTQMPQMPQMPMTMPQGWNVPVVCAVQDVKQVQERARVPEMAAMPYGLPNQGCGFGQNGFYTTQVPDSGFFGGDIPFQRARSEGNEPASYPGGDNLPVERTFIQFTTHGDSCKRSSRSQ